MAVDVKREKALSVRRRRAAPRTL